MELKQTGRTRCVRERGWMGLGHGEIKSEREFKNTDLNKKERERERVCEFKNRPEKDGIYFAYT